MPFEGPSIQGAGLLVVGMAAGDSRQRAQGCLYSPHASLFTCVPDCPLLHCVPSCPGPGKLKLAWSFLGLQTWGKTCMGLALGRRAGHLLLSTRGFASSLTLPVEGAEERGSLAGHSEERHFLCGWAQVLPRIHGRWVQFLLGL